MDRAPVTVSTRGPVTLLVVDDGAGNWLDLNIIDSLLGALRTAEEQAGAIVLAGRPGCFSMGLHKETLLAGGEATSAMLHRGTELILRVTEYPRPVVAACTGHALGAAATSLLSYDVRVGAAGDFKIGMDWLTAGLPVPGLAIELARTRLSPRYVTRALNTAHLFSPDEAVEAGFLDSVTSGDVVEEACGIAADLAERLDPGAFEQTRRSTCRFLMDAIMNVSNELFRMATAPKGVPPNDR